MLVQSRNQEKKILTWLTILTLLTTIFFPFNPVFAATTEFAFVNNAPSPVPAGQKYKFDLHAMAPRDFSWVDPVAGPKKVTLTVASGPETGQNVAGKAEIFVNQLGNMITFKPESKLKFNTQYELKVASGIVKDNQTGELNAEWSKVFLTAATGDTVLNTPGIYPAHNSSNVPINTDITVNFGEVVYTSTPALEGVTITDAAYNKVLFSVTSTPDYTGLVITPFAPLEKNTAYTLTIPANTIEDGEQNANQETIVITFTTGMGAYPKTEPVPGPSPTPYPDPVFLNRIEVAPDIFNLDQGESLQLTATGRYSDGRAFDITGGVTWQSSDPSVARVSFNGLVTAVNPGKAKITASLYGVRTEISVTVNGLNSPWPDINSDPLVLKPGEAGNYDFYDGKFRVEVPENALTTDVEVVIKTINPNSDLGQIIIKSSRGFARRIPAIYVIQARETKTNRRVVKFDQDLTISIKLSSPWNGKGIYIYDPYYKSMVPVKSSYQKDSSTVTFRVKNVNPIAVVEEKTVTFNDLGRDLWAKGYIESLAGKNIINGLAQGKFQPRANLTRSQLAKIIALAANVPGESGSGFLDIQKGHWATPFISSVKSAGIIKGYPDGSFRPEQFVTRAEMVKMVLAAIDLETESYDLSGFKDRGHWADSYIAAAVRVGIINGYPDGTFRPDNYITRAEAAKVIAKAYVLKK